MQKLQTTKNDIAQKKWCRVIGRKNVVSYGAKRESRVGRICRTCRLWL